MKTPSRLVHCVKDHWIRTEKCSVFVCIKTRMDIYGNTSLNTDEYGALFSPYAVVFYAVVLVVVLVIFSVDLYQQSVNTALHFDKFCMC